MDVVASMDQRGASLRDIVQQARPQEDVLLLVCQRSVQRVTQRLFYDQNSMSGDHTFALSP